MKRWVDGALTVLLVAMLAVGAFELVWLFYGLLMK